jgi:peptidoglycan/xylan/chitin deacetylase (PgdA/CDA1 family)
VVDLRCAFAGCLAVALSGCLRDFDDKMYFSWDDRRVVCARSIDDLNHVLDFRRVLEHMDAAAADKEVYNLYAHVPGETVSADLIERVLDEAARRNLSFVTYHDMLDHSNPRGGISLAFDDARIDQWFSQRDTFLRHAAHVTFFVTRYHEFSEQGRAELAALAADGHDIEAHGVDHLDATVYAAEHGVDAYVTDQVLPSVEILRADGYPATVFAYPFGARNDELDRAILEHLDLVRSTAGTCPW